EHLRLSPGAIIGPGARSLEFLWWDPPAGGVSGGRDGSPASPLLRSRRSQGDGGRLRPPRDRWQSSQGGRGGLPVDGEFLFSSAPALPDLQPRKRSGTVLPRRRHRGRVLLGAVKPVFKLDPGVLEHLSRPPRAIVGA